MRILLFAFLLLTSNCALAKSLEAGVTFFGLKRESVAPLVAYRFDNGLGWRSAKPTLNNELNRPYDYRISPFQKLRVEARLVANNEEIARAYLSIPVQNDRRYDVHADIRTDDPTRMCFGCSKAVSSPITGNSKERFWLWYGFNGISHRLIF